MHPAFPDNDNDRIPGIPLGDWLLQVPGIPAWWPGYDTHTCDRFTPARLLTVPFHSEEPSA